MKTERRLTKNQCDKCPYFRDIFGNYVQCVKTGRFIDYEYWHNELPDDCPLPEWVERKEEFDCNDCYYSMQNCKDKTICCEDETTLCDNFEPVVERKADADS